MKRILSLILALVMLIASMPMQAFAGETDLEEQNTFKGKKVSILSHSMSTYAGVSNSTAANSTLGNNDVYYTEGRHDVYLKDTWWQQTIDALDMELLVNNSWSGSCVFMPRKGEVSVGYGDRAVNLHNDHTGEEPDIIFVYLGCNDFAYYKDTFGKADDVNYTTIIQKNGDGTFSYATPNTTCEAYAIMLHKAANRYPKAEIYCITSTARRETDYTGDSYPDAGQPTEYSAQLQQIAQYYGYPVIDLENAITKDVELFDKYMGDKRAHANALGMDQITNEVLSVLLGKDAQICHVTSADGTVKEQAVLLGGSYSAAVKSQDGHTVVATMNGVDITQEAFTNGQIIIDDVTGDIEVHTVIHRDPQSFRWELQQDALVSVGTTDNAVKKLAGTITNGVLSNSRYELTTSVVLKHDLPWEVEWQFGGNWRGCVFTSDPVQSTKDMVYLSRTVGGQLCIGTWTGKQYDNYGVDLSGVDDQVHAYRLENRISADGSNMVWVYVDGEEIGPMNRYFIGSKDQGTASNWICGKDFVFSYISMEGHELKDCKLNYLQVRECAHTHTYTPAVTAPTCTGQGYTTYTCACGDSYVGDYTDPRPMQILMIGNSFSWDAADFWYDMQQSMTYDAMKSMLAEPYDVHLAVMYKGSATLAYHATCAMNNTAEYTYTEIGPETNYQWTPSSGTNANNNILDQLETRDWDIIVIQSYQHEADGTDPRSTYTGGAAQFVEPEASIGYLLDYFAQHEPHAEVYYYMPWASTKFYGSDTAAGYQAIAEYTRSSMVDMTGTNSGKQFAGVIPVGTGIQNARTTYFDKLQFNSGTGSTALLKDPQNGLQYDTQHLSFGIGRYIAGIIVAETLIPQSMRKDTYTLPDINDSPAVGALPLEYGVVARLAAEKAVASPYEVTEITGYETDLTDRICDAIEVGNYTAEGISDETALLEYVGSVINSHLENAGDAKAEITLHGYTLENGSILELRADVALRVGYTERTAQIDVVNGQSHHFGEWVHVTIPSADSVGIDSRSCEVCGWTQSVEVEGAWQKYNLAEHLQELPDEFCCETNLWSLLEPESVMINHLGEWVSAGSNIYSVTIPVSPGDKIYANSFDQTGTTKGIQVSFFGNYGIVKTTFSNGTYNEFHENGGYLIAPEGAIAVNIPVWNVHADNNVVNILNAEHTYRANIVPPTCTDQGYTSHTCACGDSYVSDEVAATGHTWGDWVQTTPPTEDEKGEETRECSVCHATETQDIPALGHICKNHLTAKAAVPATCTEPGTEAHYACSCGKLFADADATEEVQAADLVIAASGHMQQTIPAVAPTCTETGLTEGKKCSVCDTVTMAQQIINALGHDEQAHDAKAPTCTEGGWNAYVTCSRCDYTTYEEIASAGHSYEDGICTECGKEAHTAVPGDFSGDDLVTNEDVSYLLWHTLFPADYPLNNNADFTGDGAVTNEDVSYLLWHTLFPADYPLTTVPASDESGKKK